VSPEHLRKVEELYHLVREGPLEARAGLLAQADLEVRREVESLLAHHDGGGVLDRPGMQVAAKLLEDSGLERLAAGASLGPYKIESSIGAGGMGQVYKARDTRLGRAVAIKVSSREFIARFEREARAISSLNHPHICTLHDIGPNYLVMELVEGPTLAERLKQGALPMESVLRYGAQIADALAAAHARGIIHRDLKPGNIMITKAGVKLLDFGLAKSPEDETLTASRMVMGTPAYMAPEQRDGKKCDSRTDIYALGLILYEMSSGNRWQLDQPDLLDELPSTFAHVVRSCLGRDPEDRWQSAQDLQRELDWVATSMPPPGGAAEASARRSWLAWSVAAALAVSLASVTFLHSREKPPAPSAPVRVQIPPPENTTVGALLSLSPDGRELAFTTGGRLWVYSLESGESRYLAAASGVPFWSPDSHFIGYPSVGKIKRVHATGGSSQTVADYRNRWGGGAWNQEDMIIFSDRFSGLFRVPASGGVPVQVTAVDQANQETAHNFPFFLPDGRHFVYTRRLRDETKSAIYLGSLNARPEQQSSTPLVNSNWNPMYAPSVAAGIGYLLFVREGTLMAQPFDNRRLELTGQAAPVAEHVGDGRAFSVSGNVLVFQRSAPDYGQLTWYDRAGKLLGTVEDPGEYQSMAISPDGTRIAVSKRSGQTANIWLVNLSSGGASTRFTFGSASDKYPVWSADGSHIIFSSNRTGPYDLYEKPANGGKDEVVLLKSSEDKRATSWSRDGRFLLYTVVHLKEKSDIWVLPLDRDKKPVPFLVTEFSGDQAHFSADGHWVAYTSDESGRMAVYVRSFAMNLAGTVTQPSGKWQVSGGYGQEPRWRGDGQELYYLSVPDYDSMPDGTAMLVELATSPTFRAGKPEPIGILAPLFWWDSTADGKRFLGAITQGGPQPYTVVLNWQAGLKR